MPRFMSWIWGTLAVASLAWQLEGAKGTAPQPEQKRVAEKFVAAWQAVQTKGATVEDINQALGYCTENVVYEDPNVKAHIEGKTQIREGLEAHLGEYQLTKADMKPAMLGSIEGRNIVVMKLRRTELRRDGAFQSTSSESVMALEFEGNNIRMVRDYR